MPTAPPSGPSDKAADPVTIVEFFDYRCGYWKKVEDTVAGLVNKPGFWRALKIENTVDLHAINKIATEYGVEKTTSGFDLTSLTALDPTGISSMVTSFTKYGSCDSSDFAIDKQELNFGNIQGKGQQYANLYLTFQRPTTITRVVSPALVGASLTAQGTCIGQKMKPASGCYIVVTAQTDLGLDSELRIYTDDYTAVPMPIHITANPQVTQMAGTEPNVDEAASLTAIAGAWAYNNNQSQKMTVRSDGTINTWVSNGTVAVAGNAGRA